MTGKRITLSDIAKKTGYSINTVSHALNDKSDISEETKNFIKETADSMGYIQNSSASFLRSGKSKCISVIVGDIANPHFAILVKEIEMTAKEHGYAAFVINTNENEAIEKEAIVTSLSRNVDGIIICPVQKSEQNIDFLKKSGVPFTLMGRRTKANDTNYVICDDVHSGYIAAKHLLDKGHRKIAVFGGPSYISSAGERLEGIKSAFKNCKVKFDDANLYTLPTTLGDHSRIVDDALNGAEYTAAICFSDLIALEIMCNDYAKNLEVISFDNIKSKFRIPVEFTSISSSKTKMSNKAFEILLHNIENPGSKPQQVILSTHIVEE